MTSAIFLEPDPTMALIASAKEVFIEYKSNNIDITTAGSPWKEFIHRQPDIILHTKELSLVGTTPGAVERNYARLNMRTGPLRCTIFEGDTQLLTCDVIFESRDTIADPNLRISYNATFRVTGALEINKNNLPNNDWHIPTTADFGAIQRTENTNRKVPGKGQRGFRIIPD
jgi:hypothetical protein